MNQRQPTSVPPVSSAHPATSGGEPTHLAAEGEPAAVAPAEQRGARFPELVEVMRRLLGPGGCPWDREQSLESLRSYLLEETFEVLEALDQGDVAEHRGELGDLLFQIVFQSALRAQQGHFGIDDVCAAITSKMRRRHPHVFGDLKVDSAEQVTVNWDRLKAAELSQAGRSRRLLDGVPRAAPALLRAQRIGEKAASVGFDWPDVQGVRDKVSEELAELDEAMAQNDSQAIEDELGDLLFTLTRLAAKLNIAPEDALRAATARFEARFRFLEDAASSDGKPVAGLSLAELEVYWQQAKRALRRAPA